MIVVGVIVMRSIKRDLIKQLSSGDYTLALNANATSARENASSAPLVPGRQPIPSLLSYWSGCGSDLFTPTRQSKGAAGLTGLSLDARMSSVETTASRDTHLLQLGSQSDSTGAAAVAAAAAAAVAVERKDTAINRRASLHGIATQRTVSAGYPVTIDEGHSPTGSSDLFHDGTNTIQKDTRENHEGFTTAARLNETPACEDDQGTGKVDLPSLDDSSVSMHQRSSLPARMSLPSGVLAAPTQGLGLGSSSSAQELRHASSGQALSTRSSAARSVVRTVSRLWLHSTDEYSVQEVGEETLPRGECS